MTELVGGRFRVEAELGSGATARVFRAVDLAGGGPAVVKLPRAGDRASDTARHRFELEARALAALSHPNIVRVLAAGRLDDGQPWIALEYLAGEELGAVLVRDFPLAPTRIVSLLAQALDAMAEVHAKEIVHGDLKPENLLLVPGPVELLKVLDFGLLRTVDPRLRGDAPDGNGGTPCYMSPEQAGGLPLDHRSDLYSLGVVLYELLCGQLPFDGTPRSIIDQHLNDDPRPPSAVNPQLALAPALERVCLRALEKLPARRFQSAEEMLAALLCA